MVQRRPIGPVRVVVSWSAVRNDGANAQGASSRCVMLRRISRCGALLHPHHTGPVKGKTSAPEWTSTFRVGSDDASHFNREYKRHFGKLPMHDVEQWRELSGPSTIY